MFSGLTCPGIMVPRGIDDDFFFVLSHDLEEAKEQLRHIIQAFHDMGIPLADDKIEGLALQIIYLGILVNSGQTSMEVTPQRQVDTLQELQAWANMRTCTSPPLT